MSKQKAIMIINIIPVNGFVATPCLSSFIIGKFVLDSYVLKDLSFGIMV